MLVTPIRYDRHMIQITASDNLSGISTDRCHFVSPAKMKAAFGEGHKKQNG